MSFLVFERVYCEMDLLLLLSLLASSTPKHRALSDCVECTFDAVGVVTWLHQQNFDRCFLGCYFGLLPVTTKSPLKSVKCYCGGQKINLMSSISEIQLQMWYNCIQYTRRHLMSLISHFWHHLLQSWLIWACYLFLRCSALQAVQTTSRVNSMHK